MKSSRVPLWVTGSGALIAGVVVDRWSSGAPARDGFLSLLVVAGVPLVLYAWLEARGLVWGVSAPQAPRQTVSMVTELAPPVMRMS